MPIRVAVGFLMAALSLSPPAAVAQRPAELAFADPQPHFVAAWAPKKPREAERSAVLMQRVSLELTDVALDLALKTLTGQAGLNITYSPAVLPSGRRVTIKAGDIAVVTALTEMLFRSGVDVMMDRDGAMALVPCRHPAPRAEIQDSGTIVGTVTDKATGTPIAGASVVVEGTRLSATTGSDGGYRIDGIEAGTHIVRARYIGYSPQTASVIVNQGEEEQVAFGLEKSTQQLDELVTTGTYVPTEIRALPNPISVIPREVIEEQRPRTVGQLLRMTVPSAIAWEVTASPQTTLQSMRGASSLSPSSGTVKVYLDGVELANRVFALVDPTSIERVEVIRGPQAATLYGSDAMGGVMNIFTKRGDSTSHAPQVNARSALGVVEAPYKAAGGTLRQDYAGSIRGAGSGFGYHLGGSYAKIGEWIPEGQQTMPSLYGGIRVRQGPITADLSGRYYEQNVNQVTNPLLVSTGFSLWSRPWYQPIKSKEQTLAARLTWSPAPWLHQAFVIGTDRFLQSANRTRARLTTPADTLLATISQSESKTFLSYHASASLDIGRQWSTAVTAGIDHYDLPTSTFSTFGALSTSGNIVTAPGQPITGIQGDVKNTGYFSQVHIGYGSHVYLTAGVRAEENSAFGSALGTPVSPRVGLAYATNLAFGALKVRGSYGRAIRPPNSGQSQRVPGFSSTQLSSPNLGPERQRGWDAGVDLSFVNGWSLSATYYDQTADDLIQLVTLDLGPPTLFQFQNVGRVRNQGLEVDAAVSLGTADLRGQFAITESEIEALAPAYTGDLRIGERPLAQPRYSGGASLALAVFQGTTITSGFAYVGKFTNYDYYAQFACFGGTGACAPSTRGYLITYPGFIKVDVSLTQRLTNWARGVLSVQNATNSDGVEFANSIPVMGRITALGIEVTR